jgi:hypothetical protein
MDPGYRGELRANNGPVQGRTSRPGDHLVIVQMRWPCAGSGQRRTRGLACSSCHPVRWWAGQQRLGTYVGALRGAGQWFWGMRMWGSSINGRSTGHMRSQKMDRGGESVHCTVYSHRWACLWLPTDQRLTLGSFISERMVGKEESILRCRFWRRKGSENSPYVREGGIGLFLELL